MTLFTDPRIGWLVAVCKIAVLLCLCYAAIELGLLFRQARNTAAALERASLNVTATADRTAAELTAIAARRMESIEANLDKRIASVEKRLDTRVSETISVVDHRLGEVTRSVNTLLDRSAQTVAEAHGILEDARPGVQAWASLSPHLAANALGAVAAVKVTAGQAAQTMREIERATPDIVASIEASALASQQAAQSAAQTSQNLAEITRPGPRWLRYVGLGLSISAPAAQTVLPIAVKTIRKQ